MVSRVKNWLVKRFINSRYKEDMEMVNINIDQGRFKGEVIPDGEEAPIKFEGTYGTTPTGQIMVTRIETSRSWITKLAQEYVLHQPIELPALASLVL